MNKAMLYKTFTSGRAGTIGAGIGAGASNPSKQRTEPNPGHGPIAPKSLTSVGEIP